MFQYLQLCVQPTGSTNAETLHSGIWAPPIARKASTQTLAHICIVTASQVTWSSLPAEPSLQSVSSSRWSLHLVSSSLSVQHRVHGCAKKKPTSTSTSATICIKTSFILSKSAAHRRQTSMAIRLNRERECLQSMRGVRVHFGR